jgi:hypothetical protein
MTLDLKLVLKAGIIWGIVGVVLVVAASFLGPFLPFQVDGLALGTYAAMFAGVHFAARDPGKLLVALVGGAVAGIIAALLMLVANLIVPGGGFSMGGSTGAIIGALLAGIAGAIGMKIVQRL